MASLCWSESVIKSLLVKKERTLTHFPQGIYNGHMPSITFKTYDDAIKELRNRGMRVSDVRAAKAYLESFSIYNVINGYADIFDDPRNPGHFREGTTFSELKSLHHFDESLRRSLTHYVLKIECSVKSRATYQFCSAQKPDGTRKRGSCDYLIPSSYDPMQQTKVLKLIADLSGVITNGSFNPGPIKSYVNNGINPPPVWVLATGMTFGNTLKFYECLFPSERNQIARSFQLPEDVFDSFLMILRDFRNALAHSNRVFCFKTVHRPKRIALTNGNYDRVELSSERRFGSVLYILQHLLSEKDFKKLINEVSNLSMGLAKKLKTISILDVATEMGVPNSMRLRYGIKLSEPDCQSPIP